MTSNRFQIAEHPARDQLLGEAHARPPMSLDGAYDIIRLSLMASPDQAEAERAYVADLFERLGGAPPPPGARFHSVAEDGLIVSWERHTEFRTYTIARPRGHDGPPGDLEPAALTEAHVRAAPGELFSATSISLAPSDPARSDVEVARDYFGHDQLIATKVGGSAYVAVCDYRPDDDGFVRYLVFDKNGDTTPGHRGRTVQKLLEIETYRLAALIGFVLARETGPELDALQAEMEELSVRLAQPPHIEQDRDLLQRLSQIAGRIELTRARTRYRFAATRAYHRIVQERTERLREERLQGRQRISVFMELRLAPAMRTCEAVEARQDDLGAQLARATRLLATRVNVAAEEQSSRLLESMDDRARLQLRLQQTVEGLSVVAITYYAVGLIYYLAQGVEVLGAAVPSALVAAIATPLVAGAVWFGVHQVRKRLSGE